jgi:hypothetical protein
MYYIDMFSPTELNKLYTQIFVFSIHESFFLLLSEKVIKKDN